MIEQYQAATGHPDLAQDPAGPDGRARSLRLSLPARPVVSIRRRNMPWLWWSRLPVLATQPGDMRDPGGLPAPGILSAAKALCQDRHLPEGREERRMYD